MLIAVSSLLPVFGVVSLATAKVQVDEITQNLSDNEANVVDLLESGSSGVPVVVSGTTIVGQAPAAPGSLDGQVIDILAIGDSVMLGAANVLTERGVTVDALKSRPFRQALEIADKGYVLVQGANRFTDTGQALLADPEVRRSFLGG